jgi:hypothetical protein
MTRTSTLRLSVYIACFLFLSGCGAGGGAGGGGVSVEDQGNGTALVSWRSPTQNTDGSAFTDLAGYKIYYGSSPGDYDNTILIDTVGVSSYLVEGLGKSDWYFTMTAFNSLGIESSYSEEVYKAIE